MSIYGSWLILSDDEHEDGCAVYVETSPGVLDWSGKPCDCGTPRSPLVYEGSHVLPSDTDRRGGSVDVAAIPDHIDRDDRPELPEGTLKDWLRLSVDSDDSHTERNGKPYVPAGRAAVILTRAHVAELRDTLTAWLDREVGTDA